MRYVFAVKTHEFFAVFVPFRLVYHGIDISVIGGMLHHGDVVRPIIVGIN